SHMLCLFSAVYIFASVTVVHSPPSSLQSTLACAPSSPSTSSSSVAFCAAVLALFSFASADFSLFSAVLICAAGAGVHAPPVSLQSSLASAALSASTSFFAVVFCAAVLVLFSFASAYFSLFSVVLI